MATKSTGFHLLFNNSPLYARVGKLEAHMSGARWSNGDR